MPMKQPPRRLSDSSESTLQIQSPEGGDARELIADGISESPIARKQNTKIACDLCRGKKIRCSGQNPCQNCLTRKVTCSFDSHNSKQPVTRQQFGEVQSEIRHLRAVLDSLTVDSEDDAVNAFKRLREEAFGRAKFDRQAPREHQEVQTAREGDQQLWDPGIEYDTISYLPIVDPAIMSDPDIYHVGHLPPGQDVRASIAAFHEGPADLFPIMSQIESNELIDACYNGQSRPVKEAELCLMCSLAALGSHYIPNQVFKSVRESLARSASMLVNECWDLDLLVGLRVMLCQALFSFVEKKRSFRASLASGLQVARWSFLNNLQSSHGRSESVRVVLRSFICLDAYSSMHLDYLSEINPEELKLATTPLNADRGVQPSNTDLFTFLVSNLAKESRLILGDFDGGKILGFSSTNERMQTLYTWMETLPENFRLQSLTGRQAGQWPNSLWLKVIFLHKTYLSVVVLLNRHLIPEILDSRLAGQGWPFDGGTEAAMTCHKTTMDACRHCIQTYLLLGDAKGTLFQQSWLVLCDIFICACLLLADAAVSFAIAAAGIEQDLDLLKKAMDLMSHLKTLDQAVQSMLHIAKPLYEDLDRCYKGSPEGPSSRPSDIEKGMVAERAIKILKATINHRSKQSLANIAAPMENMPDWWI